ncbi:MAG: SDR family oxidoreductase [Enhygromyxa sp.]
MDEGDRVGEQRSHKLPARASLNSFAGRRVFITGGSSGIGKALAGLLIDEGAHVCIAARGQARIDAALAELRARVTDDAQTLSSVALDVGDREAVEAAVPKILEALGGVDLLINNAGITYPAAMLDTPPELFDEIMRVNYLGTVHVTRALLPSMIERGAHDGRRQIAIVSSLAGMIGIYGYSAYSASKFALVGFAECLRQELLAHGVGVSVAFPPDTDTPMLAEENRIKPAQTQALAGQVEVLSPEFVARSILLGLRRGRHWIIPGFESKLTCFLVRRFPALTRWILDAQLRRFERKQLPGGR